MNVAASRPRLSPAIALLLCSAIAACSSGGGASSDPGAGPDAGVTDPGPAVDDVVPAVDIRTTADVGAPSTDVVLASFCGRACAPSCSAKAPCSAGTCCALGDHGKTCLDACPQPCASAADCAGNADTGRTTCCRVNLFNPQRQCATAASCVTPCTGDADCAGMGARVSCCTKAAEPVCTSQCPVERACASAQECASGEACVVLFDPFRVLHKPGICAVAPAPTFAPSCTADADCDVQGVPSGLCCGGLCATDCPRTCTGNGDCNADLGQKCCDPVRTADWTPERP